MKQEYIDQIRAFNRFYTKVLGVLNKSYLGSEFGLPEIRVIQDVYLHPNRNAKEISRELNMDKGLLSRILKKAGSEKDTYIGEKAANDNRMEFVKLTKTWGKKFYHTFEYGREPIRRRDICRIGRKPVARDCKKVWRTYFPL